MSAERAGAPARVVVLASGPWGWETVAALHALPGVQVVGLLTGPAYKPKPLVARVRQAWRRRGAAGLLSAAGGRLLAPLRAGRDEAAAPPVVAGVPCRDFPSFHGEDVAAAIRELGADVGVLDGTPIIRPHVFTAPRLGSVNLHCGRLPYYRGSPPAFWELYNGETEVGVTVHGVSEKLDGGPILLQELFPLDPAPADDPVAYARRVWQTVLRPAGIRLLGRAVTGLADGSLHGQPQPTGVGKTYRPPTHHDEAELRRRVAARRAEAR